ncbi:hypothetical protein HN51_027705, partial [Arachis hypogaea]
PPLLLLSQHHTSAARTASVLARRRIRSSPRENLMCGLLGKRMVYTFLTKDLPRKKLKRKSSILVFNIYISTSFFDKNNKIKDVYTPKFLAESSNNKIKDVLYLAKDERIEQLENDLSLSQKIKSILSQIKLPLQKKLEKTSNSLRDLQENYRLVVSTLKEKEHTISKLLKSENALVGCAKEMCTDLQIASDHIDLLSSKLGLFTSLIKSSGCVWFLLKDKALIQRVVGQTYWKLFGLQTLFLLFFFFGNCFKFLKMFTLLKLVTNLVELKSVNCLLLHLVKIITSFVKIQQKDPCFRAKSGESSLLEEILSMLYCMAIISIYLINEEFKVLIIVVENDEFFSRGRSTLMNVDDVIIETSLGKIYLDYDDRGKREKRD